MPFAKNAEQILKDAEVVARTNLETQKIHNAIEDLSYLGEDSKQTITIFIPQNASLFCFSDKISFDANILQEPFPAQCPQGKCTKIYSSRISITCAVNEIRGPAKEELVLERKTNSVSLAIKGD
jgi:hypothetical protein